MEYVIPAVILLLLIGGFVTFLVLNATKKSGPVADRDEGAPGIGRDPTPLGDTTEHAGEQSRQGTTRDDPEAGGPPRGDAADVAHPGEAEGERPATGVARPGEAEGERRLEREDEAERPRPASERLADRDF